MGVEWWSKKNLNETALVGIVGNAIVGGKRLTGLLSLSFACALNR
jgi:hypothetical protein